MASPRGTRFAQAIQIGTTAALSLATGVLLFVQGGGVFKGNIESSGSITQSGASIVTATGSAQKVGAGATKFTTRAYARCVISGTGGLAKYPTCNIPYQSDKIGGTGATLQTASCTFTAVPVANTTVWGGFTPNATISGSLTNFNRITIATGSTIVFSTGGQRIIKNNIFRLVSGTNVTSTFGGACQITFGDRTGS